MARRKYGTLVTQVCKELLAKEWGYRFVAGIYVRRQGEVLLGINVQKDPWAPSYIVNATFDYLSRPFPKRMIPTDPKSLLSVSSWLRQFRRSDVQVGRSPENREVWCSFGLDEADESVLARLRRYLLICHNTLEMLHQKHPTYSGALSQVISILTESGAVKKGRYWKILQRVPDEWHRSTGYAWSELFGIGHCGVGPMEEYLVDHQVLPRMADPDRSRFFADLLDSEIRLCMDLAIKPSRNPDITLLQRCLETGVDEYLAATTLDRVLRDNGLAVD